MTTDAFASYLETWTRAACTEWGWREPAVTYYDRITSRLPSGLRGRRDSAAKGFYVPMAEIREEETIECRRDLERSERRAVELRAAVSIDSQTRSCEKI